MQPTRKMNRHPRSLELALDPPVLSKKGCHELHIRNVTLNKEFNTVTLTGELAVYCDHEMPLLAVSGQDSASRAFGGIEWGLGRAERECQAAGDVVAYRYARVKFSFVYRDIRELSHMRLRYQFREQDTAVIAIALPPEKLY